MIVHLQRVLQIVPNAALFVALILWIGAFGTPTIAREESTEAPVEAPDEEFLAPIIFDGETLYKVRGNSALPAVERAQRVVERLTDIAQRSELLEVRISVHDHEFGKVIIADGVMVAITTPADAENEQVELDILAALHSDAIEKAIVLYREGRSQSARVSSAIAALA